MKFAYLSESPADEAALATFCAGVVGRDIERISCPVRLRRGWPALKSTLGPALRYLKHTHADLIVVCVDGDGFDPNQPDNRREQLERLVTEAAMERRTVLALAVPAIEAWWLAHNRHELNEPGWFKRRQIYPGYDKLSLKRDLYGTERPSLAEETKIMCAAARAAAAHHTVLSQKFPLGLAPLILRLTAL